MNALKKPSNFTSLSSGDVIVVGGGSAGCAAAIAAARTGAKTTLIEKNGFLGGTAVAAMVVPMMPNQSHGENLIGGIYEEFLSGLAQKYTGAARFSDNNPGWINPEMMKAYLDEVMLKEGVQVLYNMDVIEATVSNQKITDITGFFKGQKIKLEATTFIDASGNADLSYMAGVPILTDPGRQALSLRFMMAGIDFDRFVAFIQAADPEMKNSAVYKNPKNGHWMLTTAHTLDGPADGSAWVLRPYFEAGIHEGLITEAEATYFQVFSVPGMPGVLSFNCPRIETDHPLDPLDPSDISYAYQKGREQILRYVKFCIAKFPGFENAFLCQIAPELGIRESRRIQGQYVLTDEDILACRKFPGEAAAKCSYPIDIHQASPNADKGGLQKLKDGDYYEIPARCLRPEHITNLWVAGRCISATFVAQSSLRIQAVCWAMGEYAGSQVLK